MRRTARLSRSLPDLFVTDPKLEDAMTKAIQQSVKFTVSPETRFEMYMDSDRHTQATGRPAKLGRNAGGGFTAFGGMLVGKSLLIVPKKMIVQSWRSWAWKKTDSDSILVLKLS
jgi:activator of HSP90 ATPase